MDLKLGETNVKMKSSACHERGAKKKSESSPTGFEPMTSQIPSGRSIHLSYGELKVSEASYTRFILDTRPAYCITSNLVTAEILEPCLE